MFIQHLSRYLIVATASCIVIPHVNASAYRFVNISKNAGVGRSIFLSAMNNSGTVAFVTSGTEEESFLGMTMYSGRGGPLTRLYKGTTEGDHFTLWVPDINDHGVVAFMSHIDAPAKQEPFASAIFKASASGVTTVARYPNASFFEHASINNKGRVASVVTWDSGPSSVVTFSPKRTIATFANPENHFGPPDINDAGVVVFPVSIGLGAEERIVTGVGGKLTIKATTKGTNFAGFFSSATEPRINNKGAIAFHADLKSGGQGVFLIDDSGLRLVADTSGPFHILTAPSINNRGRVAFSALLDDRNSGVFMGPDPVADRVIGPGDVLDGSIVTSAVISSRSLNDAGQIAFHAALADGREGIYRADPVRFPSVAVPEPSSVALLFIACIAVPTLSWRSKARETKKAVTPCEVTAFHVGPTGFEPATF